MSQPHANTVVLMGDIGAFYHGRDGRITGVLLRVDVGVPAVIPCSLTGPWRASGRGTGCGCESCRHDRYRLRRWQGPVAPWYDTSVSF